MLPVRNSYSTCLQNSSSMFLLSARVLVKTNGRGGDQEDEGSSGKQLNMMVGTGGGVGSPGPNIKAIPLPQTRPFCVYMPRMEHQTKEKSWELSQCATFAIRNGSARQYVLHSKNIQYQNLQAGPVLTYLDCCQVCLLLPCLFHLTMSAPVAIWHVCLRFLVCLRLLPCLLLLACLPLFLCLLSLSCLILSFGIYAPVAMFAAVVWHVCFWLPCLILLECLFYVCSRHHSASVLGTPASVVLFASAAALLFFHVCL